MPDAEITVEQLALARRAAWIMIDLHGLEQAIENVDETIVYYTKRQDAGHTTDPIWVLEKLRAALVEIQAERGTAAGMLAVSGRVRAHEGLNAAEEYDRAASTLTPEVKNRYRAQRYWLDRIADATTVHTEHPPTWPGYIDNR